jgi:ATP-dependent DNA helicase RecG
VSEPAPARSVRGAAPAGSPSGPARPRADPLAARLARLGLVTDHDLALHLPLRHLDLTRLTPIGQARAGDDVLVEGVVRRQDITGRGRRVLSAELDDGTGRLALRLFHFYPSQVRQLAAGQRVRAFGTLRSGLFGPEITHPTLRPVGPEAELSGRLTPVYPSAAGIAQAALRQAVTQALRRVSWPDALPEAARQTLGLMRLADAVALLHEPDPKESRAALADRSHRAWRTVIFDELLAQQLSLRLARQRRGALRATPLPVAERAQALLARLPFALTGAQRRVWAEISADLAREMPMNRLLQGDVGSGKTVIAALAALQAVGSGWQVAMMAPTEILAEQHHRKLQPWIDASLARVARLAGSMRESDKRAVREAVAAGEIDLLIGTHALIQERVVFSRLGLAIVDEQHRFGVAQRLALREAATADERTAHQLMMSATPIPRTLAMSYYADLDVSVIDEAPPGRRPVVTKLVDMRRREQVVDALEGALHEGRQVYWVCPLIEESEALDLQTAIDAHALLAQRLAPWPVGLVHGRLPAAEKAATMTAFARGELRVLVATTVIEVGVDVPEASLMVIEHAERFGLAQLHQLRGRVGRGSTDSVCVLLYRSPLSDTARERLRIVFESQDGFEIARRDLLLRGPGELLGARQSGLPLLRYADLERDAELVEAARDVAARMLASDPAACQPVIDRWLAGRSAWTQA